MSRTWIYRCAECHAFTMADRCPRCRGAVRNPMPPKFSPEDPYGEYRRRLKRLGPAPRGA